MNTVPTPRSSPSSPGSGRLDIDVAWSPRLLLFATAWSVAALVGILGCSDCTAGGQVALMALLAAALGSAVPPLVPGWGRAAVGGLGCEGAGWQARIGERRIDVSVEIAVEVLRGGWWLQLRCAASGCRYWAWIDAARTPRGPYRALCRALRLPRAPGGAVPPPHSAGRTRHNLP